MVNQAVSAHGGRWSDQEQIRVPFGSTIVYYVRDGEEIFNEAYSILDALESGNEPRYHEVERVEAGQYTYNYSCWFAQDFAENCGIFHCGEHGSCDPISDHTEANPLTLQQLFQMYPNCIIYWVCCRSVTQRNTNLVALPDAWPQRKEPNKIKESKKIKMPFLSDSSSFSITFDFKSAAQKDILKYLQNHNYTLFGFKAATGTGQISAGVPVWFSVPFLNIFGDLSIDYSPKYKLYAFYKADIAAYTEIKMKAMSEDEYALGSSVVFTQEGSFVSGTTPTPADTIILTDARLDKSPNITVGLAGLVNLPSGLVYLPFCAFTLTPQGSISMKPVEKICLFAAQAELSSGSVLASTTAPGCSFSFSDQTIEYNLMVQAETYGITNVPNTKSVTPVPSNQSLITLLNK